MDYSERCALAATEQGLDPLTALLTERGITHEVAQTGGFCMAVVVPVNGGNWAIVQDGTWACGFFAGENWDHCGEPDREEDVASTEDVANLLKEPAA